MRNACKENVLELMQQDRNVMLLTADGHEFINELPNGVASQFVDYGIAEQNMIAGAVGLASCGKKPFVFAVTNFMALRAYEFIRDLVCIPHYPVTFVGFFSGLARGPWGVTHHGTEDLAVLRTLPHLTIITPASPVEAGAAIRWAYDHKEAVYIRIEAGREKEFLPENYVFVPGRGSVLHEGDDVTVITTGSIVSEAMAAADNLAGAGIGVRVINMPTVRPLDEEMVIKATNETKHILTLEESTIYGGLGSSVAELLSESGCVARFTRIGLDDFAQGCGSQWDLRRQNGLTAEAIERKIVKLCEF